MMSHPVKAAFGMMAAFGMAACAAAADWPQFLGPDRDGVAHESPRLARAWPATGPKILWQQPVGQGYGGAAIYGDSVLLLDRDGNTGDVLRRFNLADGREVWRYPYDAPGRSDHGGSRPTPAADGKMVFSIGPFGQISAVKFSDGSPVWEKNLLTDWDAQKPQWAVSTSPLLYGDWVIVMPWGRKAALVAYEKATGNVVWTTPNPKGVNQEYQSPIPMKGDGCDMILAAGKQGYLIGVDAKTGKQLWEYDAFPKGDRWWDIPSPTVIGDGRIFMTAGYKLGCVMLKLDQMMSIPETPVAPFKVTEVWRNKSMGSKCAQTLLYDGYLYGNSSDVGGGLRCVTPDGRVKWDSKDNQRTFNLGNLIIADGLIFIMQGQTGELVMAEASPDGYKELGHARFLTDGEDWAPLVFKDGKLVLRDQHNLVCLDLTVGK